MHSVFCRGVPLPSHYLLQSRSTSIFGAEIRTKTRERSVMAENCPETNPLPKPLGVIRLKIQKRRPSEPKKSPRFVLKARNGPVVQDTRLQSLKRKNPFSCSPRKKANLPRDASIYDTKLFRALDGFEKGRIHDKTEDKERRVEEAAVFEAEEETTETSAPADGDEVGKGRGVESFPLDWSLKTKARFISSIPFSWYKTLTTSEESHGLSKFVRCEKTNEDMNSGSTNSHRPNLFKNTMVWMHPCLPWLNLFPRQSSDKSVVNSSHVVRPLDQQVIDALQSDWVASFRSAFSSLRSGCCPYFYLMANQSNILFQAPGIAEEHSVCVVMTPTTKGLRDSLKKEGISFTMPHLYSDQTKVTDSDCEPEQRGCDQESGDEGEWLQSVGLDKINFPDLQSSNVSRAQLRHIDQQPSSTVIVRGSDAGQALFNFLLNCKSLVANTGPLMGVPPTLLAPVAFEGASLRTLKVRQGILKQNQAKRLKQAYTLEITGPILPSCVYEVCQLLQDAQQGEFTASFSAHQLSVALNIPSKTHKKSHNASPDCGVSVGQMSYYLESEGLTNSYIKELYCEDNLFKWKST